ncbi:MAG: hypothetical protein H7A46_19150 [Verrucomicrobiales bacterium]|nr:hypothetical protein [Verrucomicrobiales bacterium]
MDYHTTSHLQGQRPAGRNILFLDGHAAWRDSTGCNSAPPRGFDPVSGSRSASCP